MMTIYFFVFFHFLHCRCSLTYTHAISVVMDLVLKFGLEINSPIIFPFLYSNHAFWTIIIIIFFIILAASKQLLNEIQENYDGYKFIAIFVMVKVLDSFLMIGLMSLNFWLILGIWIGSSGVKSYYLRMQRPASVMI